MENLNIGKIILDNAGGVTLKLGMDWGFFSYGEMDDAAEWIEYWVENKEEFNGENSSDEAVLNLETLNSSYHVVTVDLEKDDLKSIITDLLAVDQWDNAMILATEIHFLITPSITDDEIKFIRNNQTAYQLVDGSEVKDYFDWSLDFDRGSLVDDGDGGLEREGYFGEDSIVEVKWDRKNLKWIEAK